MKYALTVVACTKRLPQTTPERYASLTSPPDTAAARPLADDGHHHVQ